MLVGKSKVSNAAASIGSWLPIAQVKRWDRNPRNNTLAVPHVKTSIVDFGFVAPIVIWTSRDFMVAGHTRLKAMDELLAADPEFTPRGAPGPGLVPVRMHEFESEAAAKAYALNDNRTSEFATWDEDLLRSAAQEIVDVDPTLLNAGWDEAGVKALLAIPDAPKPSGPPAKTPVLPGKAKIHIGDCLAGLRKLPDACMHAMVTDPPYGLGNPPPVEDVLRAWLAGEEYRAKNAGVMGHEWDAFVPGPEVWRETHRVLKPGGYAIVFAAQRTLDWMMLALRIAGFEIRDQGGWLRWNTGLPKSPDALKPALEPWVLVQKPFTGTVEECVALHGCGGLHIDAARIAIGDPAWPGPSDEIGVRNGAQGWRTEPGAAGRGVLVGATGSSLTSWAPSAFGRWPTNIYWCAKPNRVEREAGCEGIEVRHPTIKPLHLMAWMTRLITPPGGRVFDPFMGSGSTGAAAVGQGFHFDGFERSKDYAKIAKCRIAHWTPTRLAEHIGRPAVGDPEDEDHAATASA